MRILSALCITVLLFQFTSSAATNPIPITSGKKVNILFVGNSLTGAKAGGLAGYVEELFKENGYTDAMTGSISLCPAQSLAYHLENKNDKGQYTEDMIKSGNQYGPYDLVVLQGYSDDFAETPTAFYNSVRKFNTIIRENGALPVMFMRWGHGPSDAKWAPIFAKECKLAQERYDFIGKEIGAPVVPIALIYQALCQSPPPGMDKMFLFAEDGGHQSGYGKYVNTFAFYSILAQKSPIGLTFNYKASGDPTVSPQVQDYMQKVIWEIIGEREEWARSSNYLSVDPAALVFTTEGGEQTISVTTDLSGLKANASATWLSTQIRGSTVAVIAQPNPTQSAREATITLSAGTKQKTVTVTQERAKSCTFSLTQNAVLVDYRDTTFAIGVQSAESWSASADVGWLTLTTTPTTLTVSVKRNPVCGREGHITVSGCETEIIAVSQNFESSGTDCDQRPTFMATTLFHEAENATQTTNFEVKQDAGSGASNNGYCSATQGNSSIAWSAPLSGSAIYTVALRYRNSAQQPQSGTLTVGSSQPLFVTFPQTQGTTQWDTLALRTRFTLSSGAVPITFSEAGESKLSFDWLALTPLATSHTAGANRTASAITAFRAQLTGNTLTLYAPLALEDVALYGVDGRLVHTVAIENPTVAGRSSLTLDAQRLSPGVYIIKARSGSRTFSSSLLIEH